jgi:hypothetical protein
MTCWMTDLSTFKPGMVPVVPGFLCTKVCGYTPTTKFEMRGSSPSHEWSHSHNEKRSLRCGHCKGRNHGPCPIVLTAFLLVRIPPRHVIADTTRVGISCTLVRPLPCSSPHSDLVRSLVEHARERSIPTREIAAWGGTDRLQGKGEGAGEGHLTGPAPAAPVMPTSKKRTPRS